MSKNNIQDNDIPVGKVSKKRVMNFLALICCLVGAIILWFYVQDYDSPTFEKKFTNIRVEIIGAKDGYSVLSGYDSVVDVTVIGRKSDINKIYSSDIIAQIDISQIAEPGNVSLPVTVVLPNGISISELSSSEFWLYIDQTATASIPVVVQHTAYTDGNLIIGTAIPSPATVVVTGPKSELEKIAGAYCDLSLGKVEGSISATNGFELRDLSGNAVANPYVKVNTDIISVQIPVYIQKEIPIVAQFIGGVYPIDLATISMSVDKLTVRGTVEKMENVDSVLIDIDESKIDGAGRAIVSLVLPAGVENVSGETSTSVDVVLLQNASRTFVFGGFDIINAPAGVNYQIITESVNVKLRGYVDALYAFNAENSLTGTVDLSVLAGNPGGTYRVALKLNTNYENTSVYAYGEYTIEVVIE